MSDRLPEYLCPKCGKKYLGISPRNNHFTCAFCKRRWIIKEEPKPWKKRNASNVIRKQHASSTQIKE